MTDRSETEIVVCLLALPETSPFALYGLAEVLSSAGTAWEELTGRPTGSPRFRVRVVGDRAGAMRISGGAPALPEAAFADDPSCAIAIVPDLALPPDADPRGRWPAAAHWLADRAAEGATICSVCSGALVLAEAGLLGGREAATHWAFADLIARLYPAVRLRPERILCAGDPEGRLVTAGGASSSEDLVLWLIARHCGPEEAVRIRKIFLFGDRTDGQLPLAALLPRPTGEDAAVAAAQAWAAESYAEGGAAEMAAAAGLPPRTFTRRFRRATGYAPLDYLQRLRIEEAKQLLERSDLPADEIAAEVGWEDPAHFRRVFRRLAGVTPGAYRQRHRLPRPA